MPEEEGKVQVIIKDETIWATQKAMAQLFDVGIPDISKHLKKKFETGELDRDVVVSNGNNHSAWYPNQRTTHRRIQPYSSHTLSCF